MLLAIYPLRRIHWLSALAALLAGTVYVNALWNPFVYDDNVYVVYNPSIRDVGDLPALVAGHRFRPITALTYAVDYALWGLEPFGYHLTNILLHMANVALLFAVTRRAVEDAHVRAGAGDEAPHHTDASSPAEGESRFAAFTAASLFAVHPMMTEAVGYISGRSELLCGGFFLLGLLSMRKGLVLGHRWAVAAALGLFALALACKEVGVMAPFVMLAYDRLLLGGRPEARRRRLLRVHVPVIVAAIVAGAIRTAIFIWSDLPDRPGTGWPVWQYLLMQFEVVWRYVFLLIAPVSQSIVHPVRPPATPLELTSWLWAACVAVGCALAFRERHSMPLVTFGVAWFFLVLVPSSSVAPLAEPMAEHRVYLASCGLFMVTGFLLGRLMRHGRRWRPSRRAIPHTTLIIALLVLSTLTVARNRVWADPVSLWRDAAGKARNTWSYLALGEALRNQRGCEEALPAYQEALRLSLRQPLVYWHLRACLLELGRQEEARRVLAELQAFDPDFIGLCKDLRAARVGPTPPQLPECARMSQSVIEERRPER